MARTRKPAKRNAPLRTLWKGAINFGLVHVPVALYPAATRVGIDFDWLDRRSMDPVGYRRVNKKTGKEVPKEEIVRGFQYEDGRYVVVSDDEIRAANVKATRSVDILGFIDPAQLSTLYLDTPYYLAPLARGEKVYALLREALQRTGKIGVATVVIQTKQRLAALIPDGPVLLLNTLRWSREIRSSESLNLPGSNPKTVGIRDKELEMAMQLVEEMSERWEPEQYRDTFQDDILALVERKIKAGETEVVSEVPTDAAEAPASNIIDLTQLLKRSLHGGAGGGTNHGARKKSSTRATTTKRKRA